MKRSILTISITMALALALGSVVYLTVSAHGATRTAPNAATVWQIVTVDDAGNTGRYGDLALDNNDIPHVSYFVATGDYGDLLYATRDGSTWITETVEAEIGNSPYTSIALDRNGRPHIAYYTELDHELRYAYFNGTTWMTATVDSAGDVGEYSSLALDRDGHPHISYYATTDGDLRYAHYESGSGWVTETLDSVGDVGQFTSLALDRNGYPHIGYYDVTSSTLKVKRYNGSVWRTGKLDSQGDWGRFTSLALDANGDEHILFYDLSIGAMMYATFDGSNFVTETIVSSSFYGGFNDLVLDDAGNPHISYADEERGVLVYGHNPGTGWQHTETAWNMDLFSALALDSAGYPHIAYHDYLAGALKYAWEGIPVPPTYLDLDGPLTLIGTESRAFTATVHPLTATVPITFTWNATGKTPLTRLVNGPQDVLPYAWDSPGVNVVTVTAASAFGTVSGTHAVDVESPMAPDLVVTHVWAEDDRSIWYSFENQGTLAAPTGSLTGLWIDGTRVGGDAPGAIPRDDGGVESLGYVWDSCSGYTDTVRVTIDRTDVISEAIETNNTWEAVWECDRQGPQFIAGPDADVQGTTVIITWETDELSSSAVSYYVDAGEDGGFEYDPADVTQHAITLTGLSEYTTYRYTIRSTDPGGYQKSSDDYYFETGGSITPLPVQTTLGARSLDMSTYEIYGTFDNRADIDHVDFYFNGEHIGSDFGGPESEFKSYIMLGNRRLQRSDFFGSQHIISGVVVMRDGQWQTWQDYFTPSGDDDPIEMDVEILAPQDGHTVATDSPTLPAGTTLDVVIEARQYAWDCQWVMLQGYTCGDFDAPAASIDLLMDNSVIATLTPTDFETTYPLDLGGYSDGGHYTLYARAHDDEGGAHDSAMVDFSIEQVPPSEPVLSVDRDIAWHGTYIEIELTLENDALATGDARVDYLEDNVVGFQAVQKSAANYDLTMDYGWQQSGRKSIITVDLHEGADDFVTLAPGEQVVITYDLVPILYEEDDHLIGAWDIKVFDDAGHVDAFHDQVGYTLLDIWMADTFAASDYVLVTHPAHLYQNEPGNADDINTLLSTMAHLATLRQGVLGYLEGDGNDPRTFLNNAISPGGDWATRLQSNFSTAGNGYVLIVGETEIVPSWTILGINDKQVDISDHVYADTSGYSVGDNGAPDLVLGRIVGNDAEALTDPLQTSIDVELGTPGHGFDRSHALLISGTGGGQKFFYDNIDELEGILTADSVTVNKVHGIPFHIVGGFELDATALGDFQEHDGFDAGDVDGDGDVEIVVADRDDVFYYFNGDGTLDGSFTRVYDNAYEIGDRLVVEDVVPESAGAARDEIIICDRSSDRIRAWDETGYNRGTLHLSPSPGIQAYDELAAIPDSGFSGGDYVFADRNDQIYVYDYSSTAYATSFSRTFDQHDGLAVGDFMGDGDYEIVVADRSEDIVYVYTDVGTYIASFEKTFDEGDTVAVGNIKWWGKDEILIGDVSANSVFAYSWNSNKNKFWKGLEVYWPNFSNFDGLAGGDVIAGGDDEILIANQHDDRIIIADAGYCERWRNAINPLTTGKDILIFRGHGNVNVWDCLTDFPNGFGSASPLLFAPSCLTGYYEHPDTGDWSMPEMSFSRGAAAYIGATEVSYGDYNFGAVKSFFQNWTFESAAKELLDLERAKWGENESWRYWIAEYNFYGDVKFGFNAVAQSAALRTGAATDNWATSNAVVAPLASLVIDVPAYMVDTRDGVDYVTIPSGTLILNNEEPQVPYWTTFVEYPAGYRVQDVTLVTRTGLMTETDLTLPLSDYTLEQAGSPQAADAALADPTAWFPDPELTYEWLTWENPEGTTTLFVKVYPFYYLPVSHYAKFYPHYTFDVDVISTTVAIERLTTDALIATPGVTATVDLALENTGAPQDVILDVSIRGAGDAVVDGLLLRTLHDLSGEAGYALMWDTAGVPAGDYAVVVELRDTEGHLLDQAAQDVRLGIVAGEVTSLSATPTQFEAGDTLDLSLVFSNTGTVPITGTAVIQVRAGDTLSLTASFTHTLINVLPGAKAVFDETWDTTGVDEGQYSILGQVLYDSQATAPKSVSVRAGGSVIYLPLVLRQAP